MEEIISHVYDYNSIIYDINNSPDWEELKIPLDLMNKRSKQEYKIFSSIIDYCIKYGKLEKPIRIVVDNIYENFFKIEDQLVNTNSFKIYISYLLK